MKDGQRTKLFQAEELVWHSDFNSRMSDSAAVHLVHEMTAAKSLDPLIVTLVDGRGQAAIVCNELTLPAWARCPLLVLHELSHLSTHELFPPHGAEFAAELLANVERFASPALAEELRNAYDKLEVHYSTTTRATRFRRNAIFAANRTPGVLVDMILDDPPERVVGEISRRDEHVCVGDRVIELSRGRYFAKVSA